MPKPSSPEALAGQVVLLARSRLTADLRFLSAALERLAPAPAPGLQALFAADGRRLLYTPETLLRAFRREQAAPTRAMLHAVLHCLLGHPFRRRDADARLWDLACDVAVEEVIRQLDLPACRLAGDAAQEDWRLRLAGHCPHMTAEELYAFLQQRRYEPAELAALGALFFRDDHRLWDPPRARRAGADPAGPAPDTDAPDEEAEPEDTAPAPEADETARRLDSRRRKSLRREWQQIARQAQADLRTFSRRHGSRAGSLMDGLAPITFEECDYSEFLRRFGAQNEVMQLSDEAFDLIYYTYGLRTYGNVPLIEPLEYRDDKRIREFVIAIDTSGSVQGEIVQSFLQRTVDVLRQSGSFTTQVVIYLIQCDAEVQSVERITSLDQLDALIPKLRLRGFGGTDFRPVFDYVDHLLETRALTDLNGLLYFTDGVGTYPEKAPAYKTAFIFCREDCISPRVPFWAIRAVLTPDNIRLLNRPEEDA